MDFIEALSIAYNSPKNIRPVGKPEVKYGVFNIFGRNILRYLGPESPCWGSQFIIEAEDIMGKWEVCE